jgi:hypothetical protein
MEQSEVFDTWRIWCEQKLNCEIRYLDNRCDVKLIVSPIINLDMDQKTLIASGKIIPLRNVLSVKPLNP